jgi:hypothetical protein
MNTLGIHPVLNIKTVYTVKIELIVIVAIGKESN